MGNNRFLPVGDEGAGELPKRVYAKVDQIDSNSVLLDAIHADWFDDLFSDEPSFGRFTERARESPIFVYQFKMKRMMRLLALGPILIIRSIFRTIPKVSIIINVYRESNIACLTSF